MNYERKCICCGEKYRYCSACSEFKGQPLWKHSFDKEECKDLYKALEDYVSKKLTANEANMKIENMNLSSELLDKIHPVLKKNLEDIKSNIVAATKKEKYRPRKYRQIDEEPIIEETVSIDDSVKDVLVNDVLETE